MDVSGIDVLIVTLVFQSLIEVCGGGSSLIISVETNIKPYNLECKKLGSNARES